MNIAAFPNFARHESSFALVSDNKRGENLRYAVIDEERLLRVKHTYSFPLLAMEYCLSYFGIKNLSEIDFFVTDYARRPSLYNDGPGYRKLEHDYLKCLLRIPEGRLVIVNHHLAHAAGVFYPSQFEEAAILIVDGMGSGLETQSVYHGKGGKIKLLDKGYCWGPGNLYAEITTKILNFSGLNGVDLSGKTMALASFGSKRKSNILDIRAKYDGLHSDYSYFISRFPKPKIKQENLFACADKRKVMSPYFTRIAYEVQREAERALIHFANHAYKLTRSKRLCVSGGAALNSVANGKILQNTPFKEIYVTPCCSDTGITLGLALYAYYNLVKRQKSFKNFFMPNAYTGKSYLSSQVRSLLKSLKLPFCRRDYAQLAQGLASGKILGWFIGGSEIGPRALGHRSILADPRKAGMKDILNLKVKHRENFRPFAPAILEECVSEYFPIKHKTPFMLEVYPVKREKRKVIPACVHVDGTGRLQTVSKAECPEFYELIKAFRRLTGVPVLLNTSFNDQEPIVESPQDALITWLKTDMDILVLEDYALDKKLLGGAKIRRVLRMLESSRSRRIKSGLAAAKRTYFKGYSKEGLEKFLRAEEEAANWRLKYRAKYELEKFIEEQAQKAERVIIYGTKKHTRLLYERVLDFPALNITGFVLWPEHGREEADFDKYPVKKEKALKGRGFDKVLVSSHEYQYEILKRLDALSVPPEKRVVLYDTCADSLINHLEGMPVYNRL